MATVWPENRSPISIAAAALLVAALAYPAIGAASDGQAATVQALFESGAYDAVAEAVSGARQKGTDAPESTYLSAQAFIRLEQIDRASVEFARLAASGPAAWKLVGESGAALLHGDAAGAVDAARRATAAAADLPWAHYQLGLAAIRQNDFARASQALARAVELKPDLAYGHYYGALAYQRQRQVSKAAEHFDAFLKLAPEAPERQAVAAIMRTLK